MRIYNRISPATNCYRRQALASIPDCFRWILNGGNHWLQYLLACGEFLMGVTADFNTFSPAAKWHRGPWFYPGW